MLPKKSKLVRKKTARLAHPKSPRHPDPKADSGAPDSEEIQLPPATDWRTTDQDEINRRILRAREETFGIRNLAPSHPVFSNFEVKSQSGMTYEVEIRSLAQRHLHCTCVDFQVNGLGLCKHTEAVCQHLAAAQKKAFAAAEHNDTSKRIDIIADDTAFALRVERNLAQLPPALRARFDKDGTCPVQTSGELDELLEKLSPPAGAVGAIRISGSVRRWREALLRNETRLSVRRDYEQKVQSGQYPPQETLVPLYPYQREGMLHLAFAGRALLADEMGLGKTIQAIAAAALLHRIGQAKRVLVVTPASLKSEWEEQITRFTPLPLQLVFGNRRRRLAAYDNAPFFTLVNYEQMLTDSLDVNARLRPDIVILDEAQRIKNWAGKTAQAVKRLSSRYAFVLTGTPIENRLDELYSLVSFLDPSLFGPLFRFNREFYELNDRGRPEFYRDLERVHERIRPLLLRRRKIDVETELPDRTDRNLFIKLADTQRADYDAHKTFVAQLLALAHRRLLTKQQQEKLLLEMGMMRMICDTPYILDRSPKPDRTCPKLDELARLLDEILDGTDTKVIIFSEWVRMLELVRDHLGKHKIGYAWHTGTVPQKKRRAEIRLFKDDPACRVFLSTDSGGVGLNLQNASVVINCDLPWNPAKLEQRIARAWRKHQKRPVTVINLIAEDTIEHGMLGTLAAKQSLAEGVLDLRGDLQQVPLRPAGQTFFQRLTQILARDTGAVANTGANTKKPTAPIDPALAFAQRAGEVLGTRIIACEERYPDVDGTPVIVLTVDRDADTWRPRLMELHAALHNNTDGTGGEKTSPRLEIIDRATADALARLQAAGIIQTRTRGIRQLYPENNDNTGTPSALSDDEKSRIAEYRKLAAKKIRLAKIFLAEEMPDEAKAALRTAGLELLRALAIEKRATPTPEKLTDATLPPLKFLLGTGTTALSSLAHALGDETDNTGAPFAADGDPSGRLSEHISDLEKLVV